MNTLKIRNKSNEHSNLQTKKGNKERKEREQYLGKARRAMAESTKERTTLTASKTLDNNFLHLSIQTSSYN